MALEVAAHPGNGLASDTNPSILVKRWTAGAGEAGEINIVGNFRNFVGGSIPDLQILIDGVSVYDADNTSPFLEASTLAMQYFDVEATIGVGDTVDFVLTNFDGNFTGNESVIAAYITGTNVVIPEPSSVALVGLGGLLLTLRRRRGA